ncbi:MAG: hypothetical protein A3A08_02750 [Candidatus Nealsonbacteria bacterium RIFCSPLOWO2_01_FULL_41_9]|uniref:Uncharacterized protein n=1 Tax=Candidatus Nealsonbacteria bacterium RIFCSPLOWO2_01_FULL_41_9 TaxID=1801671 RepID=A0A1G2EDD1_9BACT|nr:MAG: hypothetical protein A3A08_02750 [Candidatus Nealsonbacteria bacterium RIFCSPLOWO2_01_FULL_41_9]
MEKVITIPREMARKGEIVIIPRKEYEEFSRWKTFVKAFKVFKPTSGQREDLKSARTDYKKGKYINLNEFKSKLENRN